MQTECTPDLFGFAPVEGRRVEAAFDGGLLTSDAGALLLGATDRVLGLIVRFSGCFVDYRNGALIEHRVDTLVGQRIFGIALGYEDLIDHDTLRHDPAFAVLAGKLQARGRNCAPVAGKYADGQGLWLVKRDKSAGKWTLRLVVFGTRREMGLGRFL